MAIYFDKRNGLIVDKPHQAKKICPYCHINDDIKVECKFIEFNKFYCNRCDNTWKFGQNQQSKNRLSQQKANEDSLFSIALRKTERNPTRKKSKYQRKISLTKSKREASVTPVKQPESDKQSETELCPHCKAQVKTKNLPRHISKKCRFANLNQGQGTACEESPLIDKGNSINTQRKGNLKKNNDWSFCQECNTKVRPNNMHRHLSKVHGLKISKNHISGGNTNSIFNNNDANNDRKSDWYECNNVDSIDGSKYLGYLRREYENSQFGSFPLHDDYGDESWAD